MNIYAICGVACIAAFNSSLIGAEGEIVTEQPDQTLPLSTEGRNHLGESTSPYLLQHAMNPVHWYEWGDEAFEAARTQNKPIFMSIGYSTCYWCHVMERESFEDQEVADFLNKHFIAIKVDREERPDIDEIYMTATQLINRGRGGWPMSVWLEPTDLKPFFAGTYFPKNDRGGRRGFLGMLAFLSDKWVNDEEVVRKQAETVAEVVTNRLTEKQEPVALDSQVIETGISALLARYDKEYAGFSNAPKFPMPIYADFLMGAGWDIPQVRSAVTKTLDEMYMGGMYDQVGGGFHRYSTDAMWLVPHFEKMLYDNGQLLSTYAKAYELTQDEEYARVMRETVGYIERELRAEDGGFLSAQDAESNHLEGESYLWREAELRETMPVLSVEDVEFLVAVYGIDQGTNFKDPHHPEELPSNVLYLTAHPDKLASRMKMELSEFHAKRDALNAILLAVRDKRDQPLTDDKIITAWNGLMIAGYANAGRVLVNQTWIDEASRAVRYIEQEMIDNNGLIYRTSRKGKLGGKGFLIDYAAMIKGLLALYQANHNQQDLQLAVQLYDKARVLFYVEGEGWYDTEEGQSDLFVRTKSLADGAIPAATSIMLEDLVTLAQLTRESRFLSDAMATLDSESQYLKSSPLAAIVAAQQLHTLISSYPDKFDEPFETTMSNPSPVRISVDPEMLKIKAGDEAIIKLKLRMATGWHVNSNIPGNEYAIPISIQSLSEGIVVSTDWPHGELLISAGEEVNVYGEVVEIPIKISTSPQAKGGVRLMVTWQACNNDTCLEAETNRVPCAITVE